MFFLSVEQTLVTFFPVIFALLCWSRFENQKGNDRSKEKGEMQSKGPQLDQIPGHHVHMEKDNSAIA